MGICVVGVMGSLINNRHYKYEEEIIKEEIIERAQNVTTDFTNTYCAKITKQLDKLKNDVRKYPHPHERNIDDLKRKIDTTNYIENIPDN